MIKRTDYEMTPGLEAEIQKNKELKKSAGFWQKTEEEPESDGIHRRA